MRRRDHEPDQARRSTRADTVTFTAAASGNPAPSVQWEVSSNGGTTFTPITGATSTSYSFTASGADNGDEYEAVFTNSVRSRDHHGGHVDRATTSRSSPPARRSTRAARRPSRLASGNPTPIRSSGRSAPTAGRRSRRSPERPRPATASRPAARKTATSTRPSSPTAAGTLTTTPATLTVQTTSPSVTTNPTSQTVNAGGTATFTAAASGNPAPSVQWEVSTDGGTTFNADLRRDLDDLQLHGQRRG